MDWLINKFQLDTNIQVTGLTNELNLLYIFAMFQKKQENLLVVANSLYECNRIFTGLSTYTNDVLLFPMDDFLSSVALAASPDLQVKRLETLRLVEKGKHIIVTNLMGYLKFLPSITKKKSEILHENTEFSRDQLISLLEDFGYSRDSIVTSTGTYAVRGFILDVFLTLEDHPIRIEFFGNTIESIRYFDEETQLSLDKVSTITIYPFKELESDVHNSLLDYLKDPIVVYFNYQQIKVGYKKLSEDILEYKENNEISLETKYMFFLEELNPSKILYLETLNNTQRNQIPVSKFTSFEIENFRSNFELLQNKVFGWLQNKKAVVFCLSKNIQKKKILDLFPSARLQSTPEVGCVTILMQPLNKGFQFYDYVVLSEYDIEEVKNEQIKYRNNLKIGKKIKSIHNLKIGDYVVHRSHGIGIYNGLKTLTQNGLAKDYIEILYDGNDKVYVPVEKMNTILK